MNNYLNFVYVNLGFLAQIAIMIYFKSAQEIKKNWALYRCNPPYWILSENISEDFTYCVQNSQFNLMGYLLQPINYMISSLGSISSDFNTAINQVRYMFSYIRDFVTSIIENIFGVFLNLIIEFQKMIISIKDMVGKMIGIVVTIMYVLDGSIKTMTSVWNGPPGQIVKSIGSCFHPHTKITLKNGEIYNIKDIPLNSVLLDNARVLSVMKLYNTEPFYLIQNTNTNNEAIYVTGEHFVYNKETHKWIQVKYYPRAIKTNIINEDVYCLITTTNRIQIHDYLFWDWEDDILL